jgi:phosphonate transport system substrate-binding protein
MKHLLVFAATLALAIPGPIPYPPPAMNTRLPEAMKTKLKDAFANVQHAPGITPDMVRGYGGEKVGAYDTRFSEDQLKVAADKMAPLDPWASRLRGQHA